MTPTRGGKNERIQADFTAYLKSHDLRLSQSRAIILSRVLLKNRHFGAEELAAELSAGKDRVSRGTVYRTLQLLEDSGLITKIHGRTRHHFELIDDRLGHDHLVCRRCGRMVALAERKLTRPARAIAQAEGFSGEQIHIQIHGLCEACADS
jgi:Fur family transcriptional regulator, ferric uptake regulator